MFASDFEAAGLPLDAITQGWWLHRQLEAYRLLAPPLPVELVKQVLQLHLPTRFKRIAPRVYEPENSQLWLSLILKVDELVRLWRSPSEPVVVAVSSMVSTQGEQRTWEMVNSPEFSAARRELGITRQWFLVIPGYPLNSPSRSELLERFHQQLEVEAECSVIQIGKA